MGVHEARSGGCGVAMDHIRWILVLRRNGLEIESGEKEALQDLIPRTGRNRGER